MTATFSPTAFELDELRVIVSDPSHPNLTMLAEQYGCTKNALAGALWRAGIRSAKPKNHKFKWTPAVISQLREIMADVNRPTQAQIAAGFGVGVGTLINVLREHKIKSAPKWTNIVIGNPVERRGAIPTDAAEKRRLVDEAIAAGRLTKCPTGYARGSVSSQFEGIL